MDIEYRSTVKISSLSGYKVRIGTPSNLISPTKYKNFVLKKVCFINCD